jgi:hypothetical protein
MIPEVPPQRNAKPEFAPSSIIERAAQHLDWTVAFGVRHNTLRGVEETASQRPRPDPQWMSSPKIASVVGRLAGGANSEKLGSHQPARTAT